VTAHGLDQGVLNPRQVKLVWGPGDKRDVSSGSFATGPGKRSVQPRPQCLESDGWSSKCRLSRLPLADIRLFVGLPISYQRHKADR
jgi:hypothetical protein